MINNKSTTIYVVRHGESTVNAGKFFGIGDANLTEVGIQEAKKIASKLSVVNFDAIYSSDYIRAKHTAEIIALKRNMTVKTTKRIRERSFGKAWLENRNKVRDTMLKILKTLLLELSLLHEGKTILVVAHGNIMRSFLIQLTWATFDQLPAGSIENTGYIKLQSDSIHFLIKETYKVHKNSI